jgi:excisionase family DNA binding protein
MYVSIGEAATFLGVSVSTLRRWERDGVILPSHRTHGRHRRYKLKDLGDAFKIESREELPSKALAYARVSSHDQRSDLEAQCLRLKKYCEESFSSHEIISDLGSGLNYKKAGLKKLLAAIHSRSFSHLILTHKDRLLRFGSEIVFTLCKAHGIDVVILNDDLEKSFEMELSSDVIELMTVFCARLHGRRSHKNRRLAA